VVVVVMVVDAVHSFSIRNESAGWTGAYYNTYTKFHTRKIAVYELDQYKIQALYLPYDDIVSFKNLVLEGGSITVSVL
jgi:hypothetical protein